MALKAVGPDKEPASHPRSSEPQVSPQPAMHAPLPGLLQLQRSHGNRFVQRFLSTADPAASAGFADIESSIQQARGNGQPMDHTLRTQMEGSFGMDLSPVRMHTGARADALNHALNAHAFTTGPDIFFRQDQFCPGSAAGRELIAHELTHVVQQSSAGFPAMSGISEPGDAHEQEAEQVARAVMQQEHSA